MRSTKSAQGEIVIVDGFQWSQDIYQFRIIPFGSKNAPACLKWLLDAALGNLLGVCVVEYGENILIFSLDKVIHRSHLTAVLDRIWNLTIRLIQVSARYSHSLYCFLANSFSVTATQSPLKKSASGTGRSPAHLKNCTFSMGHVISSRMLHPGCRTCYPLILAAAFKALVWNRKCTEAFEAVNALFLSSP